MWHVEETSSLLLPQSTVCGLLTVDIPVCSFLSPQSVGCSLLGTWSHLPVPATKVSCMKLIQTRCSRFKMAFLHEFQNKVSEISTFPATPMVSIWALLIKLYSELQFLHSRSSRSANRLTLETWCKLQSTYHKLTVHKGNSNLSLSHSDKSDSMQISMCIFSEARPVT
jgi:hypothetical protein